MTEVKVAKFNYLTLYLNQPCMHETASLNMSYRCDRNTRKAGMEEEQKHTFFLENYFIVKEFYIIEILIVSYPNDVIVILISNCLI